MLNSCQNSERYSPLEELLLSFSNKELIECYFDTIPDKTPEIQTSEYKNFANWNVKYTNLQKAVEYLKQNKKDINKVLDLASGRGNDLNRYDQLGLTNIIGIELDQKQIFEAISRYKKYRSKKISSSLKPINVSYIQGSMSDYALVRKSVPQKVNLVVNNFSMNYMFSDKETLLTFLKGISDSLNIGSLFIGTYTDGDSIESLFKWSQNTKNEIKIKTNTYYIEKIGSYSDQEFGKKYKFKLETPYFKNAPIANKTINKTINKTTNDNDYEELIEEYIINRHTLIKYAKQFDLIPFSIINGIDPLCNLAEYPLIYDKFTKKYYDRPISISSLYSSFSFIKVSKETMSVLDKPKGLLIILYENESDKEHSGHKILENHIYCKYSELSTEIKNSALEEYNYFILNDIHRVPKDKDIYKNSEYPINPIIYKNGPKYVPFNKRYIDSRQFDEQSFIMKINKTDLLKYKKISKFEDLFNKQFSYIYKISDIKCQEPRVAIIVPYRDRQEHLKKFVKYMSVFMSEILETYEIIIVEQSSDNRKFNRGKLLNIGFDLIKNNKFDTFIFHDVDLLPSKSISYLYRQFAKNPIHIAKCWSRYSNDPNYFGGIVSFDRDSFIKINGFTNLLYGWGYEDTLQKQILDEMNISIDRPNCPRFAITDLEGLNLQDKLELLRSDVNNKANKRYEIADFVKKVRKNDPFLYGLRDVTYKILDKKELSKNIWIYTVDILLNYDKDGSLIDIDYQQL